MKHSMCIVTVVLLGCLLGEVASQTAQSVPFTTVENTAKSDVTTVDQTSEAPGQQSTDSNSGTSSLPVGTTENSIPPGQSTAEVGTTEGMGNTVVVVTMDQTTGGDMDSTTEGFAVQTRVYSPFVFLMVCVCVLLRH